MKPTNDDINRRCAEVCGHKLIFQPYDEAKQFAYYIPSGKPARTHMIDARPIPAYCTDRNALPELLRKVVNENREYEFEGAMRGDTDAINAYLLPCRMIAEAALVALHAWPCEWETE